EEDDGVRQAAQRVPIRHQRHRLFPPLAGRQRRRIGVRRTHPLPRSCVVLRSRRPGFRLLRPLGLVGLAGSHVAPPSARSTSSTTSGTPCMQVVTRSGSGVPRTTIRAPGRISGPAFTSRYSCSSVTSTRQFGSTPRSTVPWTSTWPSLGFVEDGGSGGRERSGPDCPGVVAGGGEVVE